jgi:hypothetical protein
MSEQQGPNWARGLGAVGLALVIIGVALDFLLLPLILGGLILLCVIVASARPEPDAFGDRPWRNRTKD